jgi:hypothetical protein
MNQQQQQQQQELLDEDQQSARSWQPLAVQQQQQQAGSCGSLSSVGLHQATPIRHHSKSSSQQQQQQQSRLLGQQQQQPDFSTAVGSDCWTPLNDTASSNSSSSSGWRHLTASSSPSRSRSQQHQQQESLTNTMSSRRLSPHCWSSENLLNGKDQHQQSRWTSSSSDPLSAQHHHHHLHPAGGGMESDREPFIPPPPLLDFETANLLPPLGIDVSSPSDDLHFLSPPPGDSMLGNSDQQIPQQQQQQQQQQHDGMRGGGGNDGGVNWVQIPPQYATLRGRPSRNGSDGYSLTAARKPRNNHSTVPVSSGSSGWMDVDHDSSVSSSGGGCHRTAIGSDGISRKCTCGQKMRLQQQQQQQQQSSLYPDMMGGGGHIRSEDGLAGIATLRRPVKRKVRNQLPGGSNNVQLQAGQGSSPAGSGAGPVNSGNLGISSGSSATAAGLLQQPKMETSVLLDKLLRAGALRPEDYLVLSRMERMIMANHAAGGNSSLNQSGTRVRQPKSSSDRQQQQQQQQQQIISPAESGTDMRREFEFGPKQSAGLAVSGQLASNENLYDTASPALVVQQHQYQRRLSAGNNGLDVSAGQQMRMQQPIQLSGSSRPSPGPSSPFDYYSSSLASYSSSVVTGRGSSLGSSSASGDHSLLAQPQQQQPQQQQPGRLTGGSGVTSNNPEGLYSVAQSAGPYQPLGGLPSSASSRCCPCCGSPSHPQLQQQQQQHHHHHHHHIHHTCSLCGGGPHLSAGPVAAVAAAAAAATTTSSYSSAYGSNSASKMMSIQQQQPTAVLASPGYGFASSSTGRHFSSAGMDPAFNNSGGGSLNSKYPAIGSSSVSGVNSGTSPGPSLQPGLAKGGLNHSQQLGVRTELHSLPSNEPIRYKSINHPIDRFEFPAIFSFQK